MSKTLEISADLKLPIEAVTQTFAIVARKRVGKTYTASVMAEEFIKAKIPIVVLDPTGAWFGLRSSADGKSDGFPVVIIGGSHGDVPMDEHAGKIIADLVVDHPGFYIIDFSLTESEAAQDRFATEFGAHFYRRKESARFPMHLFVDEADSFMPQRPFPGQQRMLGAYDTIVRRGGIRGIGVTLITQRPAVLNKNALTQAETLIALQMSGAQDIDAIEHWIRIHGTKEQRDVMIGSLASLQKGEAWIWSPSWLEIFQRVKIRVRETFNSSATPKAGEKTIIAPKLATVDIAQLGERIKAAAETIKANDPRELKAEIGRLKSEIGKLQKATPAAKETVKEVPVLSREERAKLDKFIRVSTGYRADTEQILSYAEQIAANLNWLKELLAGRLFPGATPAAHRAAVHPAAGAHPAMAGRPTQPPRVLQPGMAREYAIPTNGELSGGLKRMMIALRQRPGLTKRQLGVRAGLSSSSGTFGTYLGRLRSSGYVEGSQELLLTAAGIEALGNFTALPEGQELLNYWLGELGVSGAGRMLRSLAEVYPQALTKEQLGERAQISHSSGTFGTYLGKLRTLELVEGRGELRAAAEFFE